jgi:hypothetical protein
MTDSTLPLASERGRRCGVGRLRPPAVIVAIKHDEISQPSLFGIDHQGGVHGRGRTFDGVWMKRCSCPPTAHRVSQDGSSYCGPARSLVARGTAQQQSFTAVDRRGIVAK